MPRKIEISHRTIIFTVGFLGLLWLLYFIRDIILQVFVALLIMTILNPTVRKLHRMGVPRIASVLVVYVMVFGLLSVALAVMIPPFVEQTTSFANSLPTFLGELKLPEFVVEGLSREFSSLLGRLPSQLIKISVSVFSNVIAIFTVFIFALYFLLAREKIDEQLGVLFKDEEAEKKVEEFIDRLENKLGGWARGQIILMFIVGVSAYVGLTIIGVPFALSLALLHGILEIVPNVGPVLGTIPSIIVGFGISPLTGLAAAALGILIQQVENYVFVPKVMEKSAGIHPIVTLLALIVGFKMAGIVGAILSVPVVITTQVFIEVFLAEKLYS